MRYAVVVISDTHIGSHTGLCPPWGIIQDGGQALMQSKFQKYVWECFVHFWKEFVPSVTADCDRILVVHNGDMIDGNHHEAVDITPNVFAQERAARQIFGPIVRKYPNFVMIRGTEAHGGKAEQSTERIAESLKAVPDKETGCHSWWQYWIEIGGTVHQFAHHIGTTSSAAYETSAPMRELIAGLVEASQWGQHLPDVFWRSHRHRFVPVSIPGESGRIHLIVTPSWQLRTPHVERIDRMRLPHIGGVISICEGGKCQIYEKIYPMPKPVIHHL